MVNDDLYYIDASSVEGKMSRDRVLPASNRKKRRYANNRVVDKDEDDDSSSPVKCPRKNMETFVSPNPLPTTTSTCRRMMPHATTLQRGDICGGNDGSVRRSAARTLKASTSFGAIPPKNSALSSVRAQHRLWISRPSISVPTALEGPTTDRTFIR